MNLVAKEYVAAQNSENPGVLILSPFAGAAYELDTAVVANPYDPDAVAEALQKALAMPPEERCEHWRAMIEVLRPGARAFFAFSAVNSDAVTNLASLKRLKRSLKWPLY